VAGRHGDVHVPIVTTSVIETVSELHDRMPVILEPGLAVTESSALPPSLSQTVEHVLVVFGPEPSGTSQQV
jgi:hypothetical protein